MPTQIFNTIRLAAGDPSNTAETNNAVVTDSELIGFVKEHASGTVSDSETVLPDGVYVAVNNQTDLRPTGGVYVQGDASEIVMSVVQGESAFDEVDRDYWAEIDLDDRSCKFQQIRVDPVGGSIKETDIFIGDDCNVTYVFDSNSGSDDAVVLDGRLNGNIHIEGEVKKLGGWDRDQAAIVEDFAFNISAEKDIKINKDLQYEDSYYVEVNSDGSLGTTKVATPTGEYGGSGFEPTSEAVAGATDPNSATVLGIMSIKRNVILHEDAPDNINIHAAIFAGNSAAYDSSTKHGCGADVSSQRGCGFGYEDWDSATGKGSFKFLGSLSEYRSQTMGRLSSPPTGYQRRLIYDTRLRNSITPPGFPLSSDLTVYPDVKTFSTWRLSASVD